MIVLMQQVVAGVRLRLRRPGEIALPDVDIETVINRLLLGYVAQLGMGARDRATKIAEVQFVEDDNDFIVSLAQTVPDFEPQKLERITVATFSDITEQWNKVSIVPFGAWETHCQDPNVVAAFYGPDRIRLNLTGTEVANYRWKLSYREPLLTIVQTGERPPIPSAHIPMLEVEAAILCMPLVNLDSEEWIAWVNNWLPLYEAQLGHDKEGNRPASGLKALWREYLDSSIEPQIIDVRPFNAHRRGYRTSVRGYLPVQ